jgi:hypothetical protein
MEQGFVGFVSKVITCFEGHWVTLTLYGCLQFSEDINAYDSIKFGKRIGGYTDMVFLPLTFACGQVQCSVRPI